MFFAGLFGVGALLAVYVDRVTDSGSEFKANISAVFIADNTFRIILYSALHLLTFDTLKSALMLIPIAILGLFAGMKSSSLLKEKDGTEDDGSIIDSVRCLTDTAEYVAVCACLKNGRILIQNGRKNVLQKYKMHYNDTREDEIQGTQRCYIFSSSLPLRVLDEVCRYRVTDFRM